MGERHVNAAGTQRERIVNDGRLTVASIVLLFVCGVALAADKAVAVAPSGPGGAKNLTLAPELSFTDDSSSNFPIRGENLKDGKIASDRPTIVFMGTSHCWNTNREAERLVSMYAKENDAVRFLVVDLNSASGEQKALVERFYSGFIPALAVLDAKGNVVYNRSGETSKVKGDDTALEELLRRARSSTK